MQQFSEANDASLTGILGSKGLSISDAVVLMQDHPDLISQFIASPGIYSYQLGMLYAQRTNLPDKLTAVLAPTYQANPLFSITPNHDELSLCGSSEANLIHALRDEEMVIIVGDSLYMKFYGKPTAYCSKTVIGDKGAFIEGNWYSPAAIETRELYKEAFFHGKGRVVDISGNWSLMRGLDREFGEYPFIQKIMPLHPGWVPQKLTYSETYRREQYERFKNAHADHRAP